MTDSTKPTVTATGNATVSQRPSKLLLMGIIEATDATLQLAIQALDSNRKSLSSWLASLGASKVEFGEIRFSDQVEPDPLSAVRRMMRRQLKLATGERSAEEEEKRLVVVSYAASWLIAGLSTEETLVLVDRIQFETRNLQNENAEGETEQQTNWSENPTRGLGAKMSAGAMMSAMSNEPEPSKSVILFSSSLDEERRQQATNEAFEDAVIRATRMAKAANGELGELRSINSYSNEHDQNSQVNQYQRLQSNPVLQEVPFRLKKGEVLLENPRTVDFNFTLNATFLLKISSQQHESLTTA